MRGEGKRIKSEECCGTCVAFVPLCHCAVLRLIVI